MPVIQISALPQNKNLDIARAMGKVCARVAEIMNLPPQQVWATWRTIEADQYVEGDVGLRDQPRDTHPPIAELLAFVGRPPEMIRAALEAIADALCTELNLETGNAFVYYTELRAGRVYTGGAVRE